MSSSKRVSSDNESSLNPENQPKKLKMEQGDVKVQVDNDQTTLIISCDDAYQYYRDSLYENGKKGATFGNVEKILTWKQVKISLKPLDTETAKKWQSQKDQLIRNFDRILQAKNKKKKEMTKNQPTCFFDSTKYQNLTKVDLSVPIEAPQQTESESVGK